MSEGEDLFRRGNKNLVQMSLFQYNQILRSVNLIRVFLLGSMNFYWCDKVTFVYQDPDLTLVKLSFVNQELSHDIRQKVILIHQIKYLDRHLSFCLSYQEIMFLALSLTVLFTSSFIFNVILYCYYVCVLHDMAPWSHIM